MGTITSGGNVNRIAVQLCVDGVEPFNYGNVNESVKPLQYSILSLSPHLRYKPEYMLLQMLIPSTLKGKAAKKYYDWVANEMNDLHGTLIISLINIVLSLSFINLESTTFYYLS